jgi:phage FluMu protein Com
MVDHVDGNALAGTLAELFRFEPTTARGRCASCGRIAAVAEGMVYRGDQGLVLRCRHCDAVLLTVVPTADGMRVQLRGIGWLEVPASSA